MKPTLLLLFSFCCAIQTFAQAPTYTPVVHEGEIPDFIRKPLSQRIDEVTSYKKPKGVNRRDWLSDRQDEINNVSFIDRYAKSGVLLFNDPMTVYVNKVVDKLLQNDKQLRSKIHVFVLQDPVVNAFATDYGLLAVNTGLLAKIENEAELAFILAHEIIHYKEQHGHVKQKESKERISSYNVKELRDRLVSKHQFSQKIEHEADDLGYELFLSAGYAPISAATAFDRLKYSKVPYANIAFHKPLLEPVEMTTPDHYTLSRTRSVDSYDFYNNDFNTHPDVRVRKEKMLENAVKAPGEQQLNFFLVTTEEEFAAMQKIARYEQCRYHLRIANYNEAIYTAYISILNYGEDIYFQKTIAYGLYALSKYATNDTIRTVLPNYKKVVGEQQSLNFYLQKISTKELAVLATIYNWRLHQLISSQDTSLKVYLRSMAKDLVFDYDVTPQSLSGTLEAPFDKLKVFNDDSAFKELLQEAVNYYGGKNAADLKAMKRKEKQEFLQSLREQNMQADLQAFAKSRKLIAVNPTTSYKDLRKKHSSDNHKITEQANYNLYLALSSVASRNGFTTTLYDVKQIKKDEISKFRDIASINGHLSELQYHRGIGLVSSRLPELNEIIEKNDTKFALFCEGNVIVRKRDPGIGYYAFFIFTAPIFLYKVLTPVVVTRYNFQLVNIETGRIVFQKGYISRSPDKNYAIKKIWESKAKVFYKELDAFLDKKLKS